MNQNDLNFEKSAEAAAKAFEIAGARIEQALVSAAKTGELSFSDMAESILQDLAKIAAQQLITNPLETILSGFGGGGGNNGQNINVTMNLSGAPDASALRQSQGQISSTLARAVADSQRYL